ncbi:WYL domain-containing protein [Sphingomonas colocasiae]|uniref:WYL domain-containing protein n=1 Tax=Sphingomonas colocasiae TaxID=1848973 RepID=A0ABS7PK41_9SPHN|nr:WYL domain-containing protein [Sphingomonas colocasiae]MBY8820862.1 WYL domain-containing protein [Sphingomonas colocasiae]
MPSKILLEAIALHKSVTACYNRGTVRLAPHILYTRHGELHVDATTLERDGQPPRETKLGTFKLAGLTDLALDGGSFEPFAEFDPTAQRYQGETLFAIESPAAA